MALHFVGHTTFVIEWHRPWLECPCWRPTEKAAKDRQNIADAEAHARRSELREFMEAAKVVCDDCKSRQIGETDIPAIKRLEEAAAVIVNKHGVGSIR